MIEVQGKGSSSNVAPAGSENALSEEWSKNQTHYTPKEPQPSSCPECGSTHIDKNGHRYIEGEIDIQRYLCQKCGHRFSEKPPNDYKESLTIVNRQLCAILQGAKKLDHTTETKTVVGDESQTHHLDQGAIVDFLWYMKKQGRYSEETIKTRVKLLKLLNKQGVNLLDPEAVKKAIASHDNWCNGHKQVVVHAYNGFAEMLGLKWNAPYYKNIESLPFVPTEKEVDALISGCTKKISISLLLLKETGMRIGESWKLKWTDLDDEQGTIRCKAEKHGNPRQFKISPRLIAMLQKLPKANEYIFANSNLGSHRWRYDRQKTRLSEKLQNPRLKQIHFHTLRHFFATKLFDQTKSLPLVQEKLGHRNINSTMVYTHLVEFDEESQNYYHATARDEKEAGDLIDKGFQYVCTTPQGIMMFRKRK
jgi:integrase